MVRSGTRHPVLRRAAAQAGYTLIETLVVMTLLVVVIGALADGFTNASKTESDQTARTSDQEAAREALQRMRNDIHCASSATAQASGTGYKLQLNVNPGQCIAVTSTASDGVQWCTVSVGGATDRYALYRTISGSCDAADAVFQVDYLTNPNVWEAPVCSSAHLEGVSADISVNRDIATRADRTYRLQDTIALRNDTPQTGALANC